MFQYICIDVLSVSVSYLLMIHSKLPWVSDIEYDPQDKWNLSFHVGANVLDLLFLSDFLYVSKYSRCWDSKRQCVYHSSLSLFYLKD